MSLAGVGPAPYRATGQVYLTSRPAGAAAAVSLHVPVKFGDVYLGDLNVPGRIDIRDDLGLRFSADIPERFKGIPLNIRTFAVALDRKDFGLNPTSCAPLTTTSQVTAGGTVLALPGSYQVQNCAALKFEPKLDTAVLGQTGNGGRPTVQVRIENPALTGNLKRTTVTLPNGLGVDLKQIPRACPQDTFAAGACPDNARIGTLDGSLAIADDQLGGYLYLLKPPAGKVLPAVGLQFTGRFAGRVAGTTAVDAKGQLITDFSAVPDLPLTALQINIAGGAGWPADRERRALQGQRRRVHRQLRRALRSDGLACGEDDLRPAARGQQREDLRAHEQSAQGQAGAAALGDGPDADLEDRVHAAVRLEPCAPAQGHEGVELHQGRPALRQEVADGQAPHIAPGADHDAQGRHDQVQAALAHRHDLSEELQAAQDQEEATFSAKVTAGGSTYTVPFKFTPR